MALARLLCLPALLLAATLHAADLDGRVLELHSGMPLQGALVSLRSLAKGARAMTAETGESGAFRFVAVTPGRYRIEASKEGWGSSVLVFTCAGDSAIGLRLPRSGGIRGRIATDSGEPAGGALVYPLGTPRLSGRDPAQVDDQGDFALSVLPPGEYQLGVAYSGAGTTAGASGMLVPRTFSIVSGERHREVNIELPPGEPRTVAGRVAPLPAGGPVLLTLTLHDQPAIPVAQAVTDAEGTFRMEMIHSGRYDLLAAGPSDARINGGLAGLLLGEPMFGRAEVDLTPGNKTEVAVAMRRAVTVAFGSKPGPDCAPAAALRLTATEHWGAGIDREVQLSPSGPMSVSGLAPARYLVGVSGLPDSCFYLGERILDLSASAPQTVLLPIGRGAAIKGRILFAANQSRSDLVVLFRPESAVESDPALWITRVAQDGQFSLEALRPGTYRVLVAPAEEWLAPNRRLALDRMVPLQLDRGTTELDLPAPRPQP